MQKRRLRNELNNWDDVRFFLAVLESGSFSGAGERLRVDQTTVGRRLAEMEKRLGAKLFDRHGKGMRPTPAARGMSEQAGRMAAAAATIERRLSGIDGEMAGIVRIAVTEGLASGWLTPQLSDFQLAHPGILLEVISGDQPLDLGTREADVAIRLVRPEAPQIVVQRMGVMRFALYAAPAVTNTWSTAPILPMPTSAQFPPASVSACIPPIRRRSSPIYWRCPSSLTCRPRFG